MKKKCIIILTIILIIITQLNIYAGDVKLDIDFGDDKFIKDENGNTIIRPDTFKSARSAMPNIDRIYDPKNNSNKYITYYKDQYALDFESSWFFFDSDQVYNSNADVMFSIQQSFVEIMIYLIDKVYNFEVYDIFKDLVNRVVKSMKDTGTNVLLSIMLSLLGFYFAYKTITQKNAQFWSTVMKMLVVIIIGLIFFNKPNLLLNKLDYVMTNISNEILDLKQDFIGEDEKTDGSTYMANLIWEQYVVKPWKFLEFGDIDVADKYAEEILRMAPNEDKRIERLKEIFKEESIETQNMATDRLAFVCMYFIPLMANLVMICLLCILILGYQFLAIFIFILGVFVMILALLPNGTNIIKIWASKVIGFSAMKVLLTFVFTILFAINEILFEYVAKEGWIAATSIQLIFYLIIFIKKDSIISIFLSMQSDLTNPYMALNKVRRIKEFPFINSPGHRMPQFQPFRGSGGDNNKNFNYTIYQNFASRLRKNNTASKTKSNPSDNNSDSQTKNRDNLKTKNLAAKNKKPINIRNIQRTNPKKLKSLHKDPSKSVNNKVQNDNSKKQNIKSKPEDNNTYDIKSHIKSLKKTPKLKRPIHQRVIKNRRKLDE
ncbi:MAG: hypothetical protein ABF289_10100 [Clostridiales bacterium]